MNITHRGITYTVRTAADVFVLCWLLAALEPLAAGKAAA